MTRLTKFMRDSPARRRPRLNAHLLEEPLEQPISPQVLVVALLIVAVPGMATANQHAVGAFGKCLQDKLHVHAPGAHYAHHFGIGRVLDARSPRQVGREIGAPVTEESHDLGFKTIRHRLISLRSPRRSPGLRTNSGAWRR